MMFNIFNKKKPKPSAPTTSHNSAGTSVGTTATTTSTTPVNTITAITITNSGGGWYSPAGLTSISGNGGGGGAASSTTWYPSNMIGSTGPTTYLGSGGYNRSSNFAIVINKDDGELLLTLSTNGEFIINGSPYEAAEKFQRTVNYYIDKDAVGERALAKSYKRAIERCLRQIKTMDKDNFIAMLENEIEVRTEKEMLLYLKEDPEETEE